MEDYGLEELDFLDKNLEEYYKTKTLFLDLPKRVYNVFGKLQEIRGEYLTFENCFNTTINKDYLLKLEGNLEFELGEEILPNVMEKVTYHKDDIASIIVYHKGSTYNKSLN